MRSRIVPVGWTVYDDWVYTVDTKSDIRLPLFWEAEARLGEAEAHLGEERRRREALEAEVDRLHRLLEERGQSPG